MRLRSKRLVSLLLAGSMMVSMVPASAVTAFAAEAKNVAVMTEDGNPATSGPCGAEGQESAVQWAFDSTTGVLTISGTGAMADYSNNNPAPWNTFADQITEVKIADTVTKIGDIAFAGLTSLKKVNIPASTNDFGNYIFSGDTALTTVTWDAGFSAPTIRDKDSNAGTYIGQYVPTSMFDGCASLGEGVELSTWLPSSFTGIGCAAFRGTAFTVNFENWNNLTYMGAYAFAGMQNLKSFTLSDKIAVGLRGKDGPSSNAFNGSKLEKMTIDVANVPKSFAPNAQFGELQLTDKIKVISDGAFQESNLTELNVPKNVEEIGSYGFCGSNNLRKITLNGKIKLNKRAFSNNVLEEFVIADGAEVTSDGTAFTEYMKAGIHKVNTLKKLEVYGTLKAESDDETGNTWVALFSPNEQLTEVTVSGPNMKYATPKAFPYMETLNVEGGNVDLPGYSYGGDSALKHIKIDAQTYTSESGAFRNARALETVVLKATDAILDNRTFVECPKLKAVDFTQCQNIIYAEGAFGGSANDTDIPGATPLNHSVIIYVKSDEQNPKNSNVDTGLSDTHGIVAVTNGGTFSGDFEAGKLATPEKIGYRFEGWYGNAEFNGDKVTTPEVGKTYYAKWYTYNAKVDTEEKNDDAKTNYVGTPIDIAVNVKAEQADVDSIQKADLIFDDIDAVEKVEVNGKELDKPYTNIDLYSLMNNNQSIATLAMVPVTKEPVILRVTFSTPGEHTVKIVLKDDANNVICTSQDTTVTVKKKSIDWTSIEKGYYKLNLTDCTAEVDGHKIESGDIVQAGTRVTLKLTASVDNMKFNGFVLDPQQDSLKYTDDTTATFTMPESPVNVTVDLQPEESDDGIDAATVVTGVAIGAGAAVLTYHIGTELYAEQVLGKGVAVPKTHEDVALKAWELAGKPAVAIDGEPLSEAAQAEKWAMESGLMQNDAEGSFNGQKKMNKLKALRVLDAAKKLG